MDFTTSSRDELTNELSQWCSAGEMEFVVAAFDAYRDEVLREARPTDHERRFLKFMVDTVQEVMLTHDGFTDEDEAALDRFKAMAEGDA